MGRRAKTRKSSSFVHSLNKYLLRVYSVSDRGIQRHQDRASPALGRTRISTVVRQQRIHMLVSAPGSRPRAPETLAIFLSDKSTRRTLCPMEVTLGGSWVGAGHQKEQVMIRSLGFLFSPLPIFLRRGEG